MDFPTSINSWLFFLLKFHMPPSNGKIGVLTRLEEIKELIGDSDTTAILSMIEELESMFEGGRCLPDFREL
jgi:hypothetical protein